MLRVRFPRWRWRRAIRGTFSKIGVCSSIVSIVFLFALHNNVTIDEDGRRYPRKVNLLEGAAEFFKDKPYLPESVIRFEAMVQKGVGEGGSSAMLTEREKSKMEVIKKRWSFNKLLSDRITLKRRLPDVRHENCKAMKYDRVLPNASVILIFSGEALSAILRTVWSLLIMTPDPYLHEIVLVDDANNDTEITDTLPAYLKHRLPKKVKLHREETPQGLIGARIAGAKVSTGEVLIFLDAHCEATPGWIEPLLQRIKDNPRTVVIPDIDSIDAESLGFYGGPGGLDVSIGGFTWSGYFMWETSSTQGQDLSKRKPGDPTTTPTMAGGLFGMDRNWYWELGGYDPGMIGWGGENLELSFRVWTCGGKMEAIPCSHVGHIFRDTHPYFIPEDSHGKNTVRMVEVWWGAYKKYYYVYRTDLKNASVQMDLTERKLLRQKLKCKPFKWYLDNVIPHKFQMEEQSFKAGQIRSKKYPKICLDHLQRDKGLDAHQYNMGQYGCHNFVSSSQYFLWSKWHELRNEFVCATVANENDAVLMIECLGSRGSATYWNITKEGEFIHTDSGNCLTTPGREIGVEVKLLPCNGSEQQRWFMDDVPEGKQRAEVNLPKQNKDDASLY